MSTDVTESQRLLNETERAIERLRHTVAALVELVNISTITEKCVSQKFEDTYGEKSKALMEKAQQTKIALDAVFAQKMLVFEAMAAAGPINKAMIYEIANFEYETSTVALMTELAEMS